MIEVEKIIREERIGRVCVLTLAFPPVNSFGAKLRKATFEALKRLEMDHDVQAVVIMGDGRMFCGGADIREFDTGAIAEPGPNQVHGYIENFPKPVVAAIHGYALGGGLELALSCHARIASKATRLSLPEISLGIIPGSGGTQRLARLIGIETAIDAMLTARSFTADEALVAGLLDDISTGNLIDDAVRWAERCVSELTLARRTCNIALSAPLAQTGPGSFQAMRAEVGEKFRGYPAAVKVVDCVEKSVTCEQFDDGLRYESDAFKRLMLSDESKAMRHLFFSEREAARPPTTTRSTSSKITRVAVIGNGFWSMNLNEALHRVGIEIINLDKDFSEVATSETIDIAIEAVDETFEIKQRIVSQMGLIFPSNTLFVTSTAADGFDVLAKASGRPKQFVGLQLTAGNEGVKLLEIGRGQHTSDDSVATALTLAKRLGIPCAVSRTGNGWVSQRMLEVYLREVDRLLLEGCTPSQIDIALEKFGMIIGPCRWMDLTGLDGQAQVLQRNLSDVRNTNDLSYRQVCLSLHSMGRHGLKTGSGYYLYQNQNARQDPIVTEFVAQLASKYAISRRLHISDDEIVERCLYPVITEGYELLSKGIAQQAGDIDVIWTTGYGFPRFRGGPMHHAASLGMQHLVSRLQAYADRMPRWRSDWQMTPGFRMPDDQTS